MAALSFEARSAPRLRPATPDDADAMARFVNMAGEGLPLYLWGRMAGPGGDPWAVGRERARRDHGGFSWRNATIAEADGRVAGCLVGYRLPDPPEPFDEASTPAMFAPLLRLEAKAPGTWYVNVLAVEPDLRGRGIGERLLAEADALARRDGADRPSLIVSDANAPARRLYAKAGYREVAEEAMVKEDWVNPGTAFILMVKD